MSPGAAAADCAAQLRGGLAALKRDVATSLGLCSRDFSVLGRELLAALERRDRRERALELARDHERDARERLAARLVDVQGNLRVLCRVRPLRPREEPRALEVSSAQEVIVRHGDVSKSFSFLRVLGETDGQRSVFREVAPLVRAAADGHHASVFTYGQTGAGKTYTLQGPARSKQQLQQQQHHQQQQQQQQQQPQQGDDDRDLGQGDDEDDEGEEDGVYARATRLLFDTLAERTEIFRFSVSLQMVEVYNEEIFDLLSGAAASSGAAGAAAAESPPAKPLSAGVHAGATSILGPPPTSAGGSPPVGEIRHGEDGLFLKNVASVRIQSARDASAAIARGAAASSSSGASGDRASRAHTVVLFHIARTSRVDGAASSGRLVLVDLAGSERLASPAAALALREAQHVNKSLAAVGDVLAAVVAREKHVPFRNSKLTHLLQDSLGAGARSHALLLVHVSPARADIGETVNSLKFAARVCRPPQVIAGRHRALRGEIQTQRAELSRLNQVVSTQAAQLQALQDKLAAEVELRKKCERRLEEDAAAKKKLLLALATGRRASTSPPDGRRWSLYARKETSTPTVSPPSGIENVAENILRSRSADDLAPTGPDDALIGKLSGRRSAATPKRRRSLPGTGGRKKRGRSPSPSPARAATTDESRSPASKAPAAAATAAQVRGILKKRRGNGGEPVATKQVSFDLSLHAQSPPAPRQPIASLRTPAPVRRAPTGASRVLAPTASSSAAALAAPGSPAKRVSATPVRRKPKWNAGWR